MRRWLINRPLIRNTLVWKISTFSSSQVAVIVCTRCYKNTHESCIHNGFIMLAHCYDYKLIMFWNNALQLMLMQILSSSVDEQPSENKIWRSLNKNTKSTNNEILDKNTKKYKTMKSGSWVTMECDLQILRPILLPSCCFTVFPSKPNLWHILLKNTKLKYGNTKIK